MVLVLVVFAAVSGSTAQTSCECVSGQVIVQVAAGNNLASIASQHGLNPTPLSQIGSPAIYLMAIANGQSPTTVAQSLSADARVIFAEVNRKLSNAERPGLAWTQGRSWTIGRSWAIGRSWTIGNTSRFYTRQWFQSRIRLDQAFAAAGTRGRRIDNNQPIVVAVLDTGIDRNHPALADKLVPPSDHWDFVDGDNDPSEVGELRVDPSFGHGTHVAGIIALTAPDAKIMPIRILDRDGSGDLWRITAGLIWAANHGADVANLSIGYPEDVRVLHDLLDCVDIGQTATGTTFPEIGTRRLAVSVASGNGGNTNEVFPAAERRDGMLSVAASSDNDRLAPFSSYQNSWVDVTAPGIGLVSTMPGGGYAEWSGTSMAAPVVAGLTALVKARYPTTFATQHDLLEHVKETAVDKRFNAQPWGEVRLRRVDALCAVTSNTDCPIPSN